MPTLLKQEKFLLLAIILCAIALPLEHSIIAAGQAVSLVTALVLVAAIILTSQRVAHHAELLAERVGEPFGTMILTLAAVLVEVVILAIMMSHTDSPTLARDTIYSAVMLDMNGILGISALLGGLRHGEQAYNVDSGNSYIVMILTAMGVSMFVPEFIPADRWQLYSVFSITIMLLMYGMFLRLQTTRHSYFFSYSYATGKEPEEAAHGSVKQSAVILVLGVVVIGLLSEVMAQTLDTGLEGTGVPPIVAALIVAAISASAEILTAVKAALGNRMQSVVNIALGASLSTVILTIPVIEVLALILDKPIQMGLSPVQTAMCLLTMIVASINLHDGETNAIEGMTHFVLFLAFLMVSALGL
jgi:Ca2+:H+ antiporter